MGKIMMVNPSNKTGGGSMSKTSKITYYPTSAGLSASMVQFLIMGLGMVAGLFAAARFAKKGDWTAYALTLAGGWAAGVVAALITKGKGAMSYAYSGLLGSALACVYKYASEKGFQPFSLLSKGGEVIPPTMGWASTPIGGYFSYPDGDTYRRLSAGEWEKVRGQRWSGMGSVVAKGDLGVVVDKGDLGAVVDVGGRSVLPAFRTGSGQFRYHGFGGGSGFGSGLMGTW